MNQDNIDAIFSDEDESEEDKKPLSPTAGMWPYPLASGGGQLLPGRTRRCAFWVSAHVPLGTRYIVDTGAVSDIGAELLSGRRHNPAGDALPADTLLVLISPQDEVHIRKAMATWSAPVGPALVAARIIDAECRKDATLAERMRWKVRS